MKKKITITFNFFQPVKDKHKEYLEERAIERIKEMWGEGYTSGELIECPDDKEYKGWWELTTETM